MSVGAQLWAHLQSSLLLWALAGALLPKQQREQTGARLGVPLVALAIAYLPIKSLDLTAYLYAYSGALSVPGLALLAHYAATRWGWGRLLPARDQFILLLVLALWGLAILPMTLGLGSLDPYNQGYLPIILAPLLAASAGLLWWRGHPGAAWTLLIALAAWALGAGESDNLWDYLVDAWSALAALIWLLGRLPMRRRAR